MPRVPQYTKKEEYKTILGERMNKTASPQAFGAEQYRELGEFGEIMYKRGLEAQEEEDRHYMILGKAVLDNWANKYMFTPEQDEHGVPTGIMHRMGLRADGITDAFAKEYDAQTAQIAQKMKTPRQRELFTQYANDSLDSYLRPISKHQAQQHQIAGLEVSLAGNKNARSLVVADPLSKEVFNLAAATVRKNNEWIYGRFGQEVVDRRNSEDISGLRTAQIETFLAEGDGEAAAKFFEWYNEEILPERRAGVLSAVDKVYKPQKAALAAEEVYARHGLQGEDAARAEMKENYGQDADFSIYDDFLKAKYIDGRLSQKREQKEAADKLSASLSCAGSLSEAVKQIEDSPFSWEEKRRYHEEQRVKYETLASPEATEEQRRWAEYELKCGMVKHLDLTKEKYERMAQGDALTEEEQKQYGAVETRLGEYKEFLAQGGYSLGKSAGSSAEDAPVAMSTNYGYGGVYDAVAGAYDENLDYEDNKNYNGEEEGDEEEDNKFGVYTEFLISVLDNPAASEKQKRMAEYILSGDAGEDAEVISSIGSRLEYGVEKEEEECYNKAIERFGELGKFVNARGFVSLNPPETENGFWNDTKEYLEFLGEAASYAPTPAGVTLKAGKAASWLLGKSSFARKLLGRFGIGAGKAAGKFINGKLFETSITLRDGTKVTAIAETVIKDKTLTLKNIAIYSNTGDIPNAVGVLKILNSFDIIKQQAREQGFEKLIITGQRAAHSTSANPGKLINRVYYLTKQ